ncbi:CAK-activating kinase [Hyphodiscus hymeniophilus]|uniref:cyclin-dependent kinase n=1 Tax=Hyphodiscus hymeniophilus TaxID=353542 RepID=A0A9P6VKQ4_9HELO|nr:CAK-activating kinase [Hyphodiscus hymeniophilus]
MDSASTWRTALKAADRYDNIERLRKDIEAKGLSATGTAHKAAFSAENNAYTKSASREDYDAACNLLSASPTEAPIIFQDPVGPGIRIGSYENCHYVANGLVSEVYRSKFVALKVITETYNVEPHNPGREVKILQQLSHPSIITLSESFRDEESRLVMTFPFMPLTLAKIIGGALVYLHQKAIIHRDIKPSNLLLASPTGPAYLSDFGTAWHPDLSIFDEPAHQKVLEVGTTCYRAPETLFGNRSYGTSLDMWEAGTMLVECLRKPPTPLFESRDTSADGNQLGLILSMFQTLGTPTKEIWPEAVTFPTPPFEWYQSFPGKSWDELLPNVEEDAKDLVTNLVCFDSGKRLTALEVLAHPFFNPQKRNR